jgi:hypothetical protein
MNSIETAAVSPCLKRLAIALRIIVEQVGGFDIGKTDVRTSQMLRFENISLRGKLFVQTWASSNLVLYS